jgi:hypothetical protein
VRGVGIEERTFVAKSTPLDDGQVRVSEVLEVAVGSSGEDASKKKLTLPEAGTRRRQRRHSEGSEESHPVHLRHGRYVECAFVVSIPARKHG